VDLSDFLCSYQKNRTFKVKSHRIFFFSSILIFTWLIISCKSDKTEKKDANPEYGMLEILDSIPVEPKEIFYQMSLPVEMARLFEQVGANYFPEILNSTDQLSRYDTPLQVAMNLGVFGVDLSYVKIFERQQDAVNYFSAIQRLSDELGIPQELYTDVLINLEKFVSNKDSLAKIATKIYRSTDNYLRGKGEKSSAAMIMMGGWVEGMYIATQIYERDQGNIKLLEKIAEQKYSLNSLISMMNNYHGNDEITEYLLMLKNLRRSYDRFQIYYKLDDVNVDTINKVISASRYFIDVKPENILEISSKLASLRNKIVR
jgi:hypothetical protein